MGKSTLFGKKGMFLGQSRTNQIVIKNGRVTRIHNVNVFEAFSG